MRHEGVVGVNSDGRKTSNPVLPKGNNKCELEVLQVKLRFNEGGSEEGSGIINENKYPSEFIGEKVPGHATGFPNNSCLQSYCIVAPTPDVDPSISTSMSSKNPKLLLVNEAGGVGTPEGSSRESSESISLLLGRKVHRFCGILAFSLSCFLIVTSLLDTDIKLSHINNPLSAQSNYWTDLKIPPSVSASTSGKTRRLPQCIIIGARKCGTRALIDMLSLHPQIFKAGIEVHFFDRDENYAKGLDWYKQHMAETYEDQISIEKSPSYFVTPEVPERIHGMNSSIKLLLIVREPITRVISDFTQIYGTNSKPASNGSLKSPSFEDMVLQSNGEVNVHYKAVRISLYSRYLQRWLDVFPPSQILTIDGDALIRDPYPQVREVERFLGLEPRLERQNFYFNVTKGFYCWRKLEVDLAKNETALHCLNDSKGRTHPPVPKHIVTKLRKFYYPHNLRFYEMVGRDFGWPEK